MMDAINAKLPPTSTTSLQLKNLKELYEIDMKGARSLLKRFIEKGHAARHGQLNFEDFCEVLSLPRNEYTQKIFTLLDADESGFIDFEQFLIGLSVISRNIKEDNVAELVFKSLDDDGDGAIYLKDFHHFFRPVLPRVDATKLFKEIDTDGDGIINYNEFITLEHEKPELVKMFDFALKRRHKLLSTMGRSLHSSFE